MPSKPKPKSVRINGYVVEHEPDGLRVIRPKRNFYEGLFRLIKQIEAEKYRDRMAENQIVQCEACGEDCVPPKRRNGAVVICDDCRAQS